MINDLNQAFMLIAVVKEFRKLVTVDEAKKIIRHLEVKSRIKSVDLDNAEGCVLAADVVSDVDVPPFDRASMDGYAVCASDTYQAREDRPALLRVVGSIPAGINPDIFINRGEAAEIATGAVMPGGADSVVMVEYTHFDGGLYVQRPVSINENVMHAGADMMVGERILRKGTILTAREIGVIASIGKKNADVLGLNVGIISTGNELMEPGEKLLAGKIYDINSYSIFSAVKECGGMPIRYPKIRDDEQEMKKALGSAAEDCDIILTSGSTSAGSGDMMYRIIEENGTIFAHGIDIKPGKPAIIGKVFGKTVFGLPGYPVSSLTIFNEFVAPLIREVTGKKYDNLKMHAKLAARIRTDGRSQLLPVSIVRDLAFPVLKGSGAITTLSEADGFIVIQGNVEMIEVGEDVNVTLFGKLDPVELLFIGSHCPGLDILGDLAGLKIRTINTGSSGGLSAIRNGTADIAGVHLLDELGIYNTSFLEKFKVHNAVLVKGYLREQGLIVKKDSGIERLEDVIGKRFINRNTGSGTRVLTDLKLRDIAQKRGIPFEELVDNISGYYTEAKTHSAVAAAVKLGKADAGIGVRTVAEMNGLKFIKIADEEYDFVIPVRLLESCEIKKFLMALRSKEFKDKLSAGLCAYERTGKIEGKHPT